MIGAPARGAAVLSGCRDSSARKTHGVSSTRRGRSPASPTHVGRRLHEHGTVEEGQRRRRSRRLRPPPFGGPFGALATIAGRTPRRGDAPCRDALEVPEAVAVDGARIATAEFRGRCEGDRAGSWSIADLDPATATPSRCCRWSARPTAVRLAGNLVAWLEQGGERSSCYDLAAGAEALRVERFDDRRPRPRRATAPSRSPSRDGPRPGGSGWRGSARPGCAARPRRRRPRRRARRRPRALREARPRRLPLAAAAARPRRRRAAARDVHPAPAPRRRPRPLAAPRGLGGAEDRSADYEAKPSGPARIVSRAL